MHKNPAGIFLILMIAATTAIDATAGEDTAARPPAADDRGSFDWHEFVRDPEKTRQSGDSTVTSYLSLLDALEAGAYAEAEIVAKQVIDGLLRQAGDNDDAQALANLATVQYLAANFDASVQNFQASIERVESRRDMLSPELVLPLRGLAAAYTAREQPVLAARTLDRALHISNVNDGPHSPSQIPILRSLLELNVEQGDNAAALALLDRVYLIEERHYTPDAEALLPTLYFKAAVHARLGMELAERNTYRQIIDITRATRGKDDISLVEPYLSMARTFVYDLDEAVFRSLPTAPTAEWYFQQALDIAQSNPQADTSTRNRCLLSLADYYTIIGDYSRANALYQQAWTLLSADDDGLAQRRHDLEINQALSQRRPHEYANFKYGSDIHEADPADLLNGYVSVTYTIDEHGETRDIQIAEADPRGFTPMETRVRQAVKKFVFRPRYTEGQAVPTSDQVYTHRYFYRPTDLE